MAFIADTDETWGDIDNQPDEAQLGSWPFRPNEADHVRTDTLSVQVICDPVVKSPTNEWSTISASSTSRVSSCS